MSVAPLLFSVLLLSSCSSPSQEANSSPPSATSPTQTTTTSTSTSSPTSAPTEPVTSSTTGTSSSSQDSASPTPAPTTQTQTSTSSSSGTTAPTASSTTQEPITLRLAWDPVNDSSVKGYKVHFGTSSRQYDTHQDVGNVTSFVSSVSGGYTWYFAVSAYNAAGDGALSQEIATPSP
jgi:hypothetical protein